MCASGFDTRSRLHEVLDLMAGLQRFLAGREGCRRPSCPAPGSVTCMMSGLNTARLVLLAAIIAQRHHVHRCRS